MNSRRTWLLASAFILALALPPPSFANDLESRVRAAFLYNLAKFVEWPSASLSDNQINICVLEGAEFARVLQSEIADKPVGRRTIAIRAVEASAIDANCQILHMEENLPRQKAQAILQTLAARPVLTVGHPPEFTGDGGILRLKREQGRLRFEIALDAGQEAGLVFSSKLLRVAEVVGGAGS